jgi:hypothetical protein
VRFDADDGRQIEGEVIRVSKKTVTVCSGDGHHWRVSPSFLTKLSGPIAPWDQLPATKDDELDETDEPSQEQFDRCRETVGAWWSAFEKTRTYKGLPEELKRNGWRVVTAFTDFMYNYAGYVPARWTDDALHEIVTDIMPRKIRADELFFASVAPVLASFFAFLHERKLQKNAAALTHRVHDIGDEIVAVARKRAQWRAEQRLSATLAPGDLVPGNFASRLPSRQEPVRNDTKVGRNEPCPCGSGKKFKKCCAGKLSLVEARH